jgi:hypothetical protein
MAAELYQAVKRPDGIAAMQHNLGIAHTLGGDVQAASHYLANAAINAPANLKWQVTHTFNPGIASVTRPVGQAGLPFLLRNVDGKWSETASGIKGKPQQYVNVIRDLAAVQIDLQAEGAAGLEAKLLQPRIEAKTLEALDTHMLEFPQFVSYLTHVQGFILPLALGDTYSALGDYEKAATYYTHIRDYNYLNQAIERPMVWRKLAWTHLCRGHRLYRDRDMAGAQSHYEQIVRINEDGSYSLTGPLYSGGFAPIQAETLAFLNAPNPLAFMAIDYARRIIILEALADLQQILNGINYLGFSENIVPIHSWHYLQNAARYFANQAVQAERAYISFKNSAEQEEFTKSALEQAVAAQEAAVRVEEKRVAASEEQRRVAELNTQLVQTRLDNVISQKKKYDQIKGKLTYYDEIIAFANGADRWINIREHWHLQEIMGVPEDQRGLNWKARGQNLVQLLTRKRSGITQNYESENMTRRIAELSGFDEAGKPVNPLRDKDGKLIRDKDGNLIPGGQVQVSQAQVDVANKMVSVAEAQKALADLRKQQAEAQLENFKAQEFTPELWDNLAQAQREIGRRYLDWAIGAAFLMERAFEFEYDTEVNRIRFDYERSELHGLLAADFLLADIDRFSYDRLLETEKQVPSKVSIALADLYPYQFHQQFQRTGRIDFETFLDDFDRWHPGAHLRKLRRVEVVIEGLVGPQGLHGTLTNSGISYYRDRRGNRKIRLQKPETMLLSRYNLRYDGFIFTAEEDVLAIFENSGVASGWILEFPPESNDIDYQAITNIHLVFYFDAYHSEYVANIVRAEMAANAIYESKVGLGLRFQYPDEFFNFQDTGEVTFILDNAYLPYDHTNPQIQEVYLLVEIDEETSPVNLVVEVIAKDGGTNATDTTDANGMISTDTAVAALNTLRATSLMDTWTVRIPDAANATAFAAGFTWEKVNNIFFFVEYTYTPRGRLKASDDFSADLLSFFDVVDDPNATTSGPSNWNYDVANHRLQQTSNIFGGSGSYDSNKPGTYLIHQTSTEWPELRNLVLECHLSSGDNDGIGVVFRYQDVNNFYFFLMDAERHYRRIGKKVGGIFQELEVSALDTFNGYGLNQDYKLTVAAVNDAFKVYLDGVEILTGRDRSILQPGRVGFYAWGNSSARFLNLTIQSL